MTPFMKMIAFLLMVALFSGCSITSQKLKEESREAYPNREWQRPSRHWSPP